MKKDGDKIVAEYKKALFFLHTLSTMEYLLEIQPGVLLAWLKLRRN